jgi:hypothetical protein
MFVLSWIQNFGKFCGYGTVSRYYESTSDTNSSFKSYTVLKQKLFFKCLFNGETCVDQLKGTISLDFSTSGFVFAEICDHEIANFQLYFTAPGKIINGAVFTIRCFNGCIARSHLYLRLSPRIRNLMHKNDLTR